MDINAYSHEFALGQQLTDERLFFCGCSAIGENLTRLRNLNGS
jgi:hypothetical protein